MIKNFACSTKKIRLHRVMKVMEYCAVVRACIALGLSMTSMAFAVAPANDLYANRTVVTGSSYTITTSNVDATTQSGENTLNGEFGSTIWWQWTAPSSGWVNFNTYGSEVDTVMRVTRTPEVTGSLFGLNDDETSGFGESSLTFQVTSGQVLYICIGGYSDDQGTVVFNIRTGAQAQPEVWISAASFSPTSVIVTNTAQTSVFSATIAGTQGTKGSIDITSLIRSSNGAAIDLVTVPGNNFTVGTTAATRTIQVPRYIAPGGLEPTVTVETEDGNVYEWGNARSGLPYLMTMPTLTVSNTGLTDTIAPVLSAFSISSRNVNVNSNAVTLQVSMTVTDTRSGVAEVGVYLLHPSSDMFREINVSRTAGTITNGTWTGSVIVPKEYPTELYDVYIELTDQARNFSSYGEQGANLMPGGDVLIQINGGGPYWLWAYEFMEDSQVDLNADLNQDGVDHLTCYAFGLDPFSTAIPSDLPIITVNTAGRLEMEYFRRMGATGVTYMPQFSENIKEWSDFTGTETVLSSDFPGWNIVTLEDAAPNVTGRARFARMKLTYLDP
jgi:hypothetical protein